MQDRPVHHINPIDWEYHDEFKHLIFELVSKWHLIDKDKNIICSGTYEECLQKKDLGVMIVSDNDLASALY